MIRLDGEVVGDPEPLLTLHDVRVLIAAVRQDRALGEFAWWRCPAMVGPTFRLEARISGREGGEVALPVDDVRALVEFARRALAAGVV